MSHSSTKVTNISWIRMELEFTLLNQPLLVHTTSQNNLVCELRNKKHYTSIYVPFNFKGVRVYTLIR